MNSLTNDPKRRDDAQGKSCPSCGGHRVTASLERQRFTYGRDATAVQLEAEVPVLSCDSCAFEFTGPEAEVARHEAVCTHLGMLTPREITRVREQYALSRAEFSRVTAIGEATLARWERGALVQNPANDRYLRLLANPQVFGLIQGSAIIAKPIKQPEVAIASPAFRAISDVSRLKQDAKVFSLRRTG